jgi:creatinine amidohydrolase
MRFRSHLWSDLTRWEIAAARDAGALVVIPIGATEQHSDHLPTGTDNLTSGRISLLAAQACAHPVLVAPTISVAFSPHHASWPGTLTLRLETLLAVIEDITASIARAGFTRQLLVNGHGGNRGPLISMTSQLVTSGREVSWVHYSASTPAELRDMLTGRKSGGTHAGERETALVMALEKDDPEKLAFYRARAANLEPRAVSTYWRSENPNAIAAGGGFWPSIYKGDDIGYSGDPGSASLETGEAMVAAFTEKLAAYFAAYATAELRSGTTPATEARCIAP